MVDIAIPALLFFLMFIIGAGLTGADFKRLQQQPWVILSATIGQLLLLPLAAWLLIKLMQPSPVIAAGMMLIALCPGGAVSNFYSFLARANAALSVTLTAVSSVLATLLLPILVTAVLPSEFGVGADSREFSLHLSMQLILLLLCPVAIGMLLRKLLPRLIIKNMSTLERLGMVGLLLLLAAIFIQNQQQIIDNLSSLVLTAIGFSAVSIAVAWLQCRLLSLEPFDRAAIIIEYPVRNLALAAMIAVNVFDNSDYLLFAAVFFVVQTPVMLCLVAWYRRTLTTVELPSRA